MRKTKLPTVPVDATAVRRDHLIPVDGIVATITAVGQPAPGRLNIFWRQADAEDDTTPISGTLPVREDDDVLCIRKADWLASQDSEVSCG
ncbi:hypothetical protein ACQP2T_13350 [Nonomuraea sp. CA-143628]|uniref:hypothetical protein n=1 Tax=Nonomuraea sp. CA-143628 TaxID=3239997 RepID=UPI003D9190F9